MYMVVDIYTHKGMTDFFCESESVRTWKSCSGSGKKVNGPDWKIIRMPAAGS